MWLQVKDHFLEKENSRKCFNTTDTQGLARAKEAKARILSQKRETEILSSKVDELTNLVSKLLANMEKQDA